MCCLLSLILLGAAGCCSGRGGCRRRCRRCGRDDDRPGDPMRMNIYMGEDPCGDDDR
jgi:hypothetical protein